MGRRETALLQGKETLKGTAFVNRNNSERKINRYRKNNRRIFVSIKRVYDDIEGINIMGKNHYVKKGN